MKINLVFFFNFPRNANEISDNLDMFRSVYLALLLKVLPEIKTFRQWPLHFFLQISFEEVISMFFDSKYFWPIHTGSVLGFTPTS
jgi:hypothetical protein